MAIVLAIFVVLTTIGFATTRDLIPRNKARRAALQFQSNVYLCRNLAVQSGRECRILLVDYDAGLGTDANANAGAYWVQLGDDTKNSSLWDTLPLDADADGTDDDQGEGIVDLAPGSDDYMRFVSIARWDDIGGPGTGNANAIVFDSRGFVSNPNADFSRAGDGYLHVSFVNKKAYVEGIADVYSVRIARSGMVRVDPELNPQFDDLPEVGFLTTSTSD